LADLDSFARNGKIRMFSVDTLERNASKGHGLVTSVAAANNILLVGTIKGWLVHPDFAGTDSNELDLSTRGVIDQWIHKVFIDPGRHSLATLCSSVRADTYYIHGKWKKPGVISRLKGMTVSSVAWNHQQINEGFTREVILGTTNDQLYETTVEEKDKKEKYRKLLFEIMQLQSLLLVYR